MREPSTNPSTTRRGPSCLALVAAVLGTTVLLVGLLALFAWTRLQRATGTRITATDVTSQLPASVPVYPGFRLDEAATRRHRELTILSEREADQALPVREQTWLFHSPDNATVAGRWYETGLRPQGWLAQDIPASGIQGRRFRKGPVSLMVWDSPDSRRLGQVGLTVVQPSAPTPEKME